MKPGGPQNRTELVKRARRTVNARMQRILHLSMTCDDLYTKHGESMFAKVYSPIVVGTSRHVGLDGRIDALDAIHIVFLGLAKDHH